MILREMNILGIDTSGREGSVALVRGDAGGFELLEIRSLTGGMYSAELVPRIADVLGARKLSNAEIDLFAVCSGPGSFTGLRVGLSAAKALAEVLGKPLVASTVLEAICVNAAEESDSRRIVSLLDAQRGEVFCGDYEVNGPAATRISEWLTPFQKFVESVAADARHSPIFTPDEVLLEKFRVAGVRVERVARPTAESFARIGLRKFLAGQVVKPEELDADYIRRSDAEIFSSPK